MGIELFKKEKSVYNYDLFNPHKHEWSSTQILGNNHNTS